MENYNSWYLRIMKLHFVTSDDSISGQFKSYVLTFGLHLMFNPSNVDHTSMFSPYGVTFKPFELQRFVDLYAL